ncbi:MAG: fibrobacter succinogenes major paralogous domain-containing protein [bacterium]
MKYLSLLFSIAIIIFGSCSKNDDHDIEDFSKDSGTFIDERDGNKYDWVKIGEQIWMAENLAYLPEVRPPSFPTDIDDSNKPYYYVNEYDGTSIEEAKSNENYKNYGVLYNWAAAMDGEQFQNKTIKVYDDNPSEVQGVCPTGWHLPSKSEIQQLEEFIILDQCDDNSKCPIHIHLMSEEGWFYEEQYELNGFDTYGFKALPGGTRNIDGTFSSPGGVYSEWWTATYQGYHSGEYGPKIYTLDCGNSLLDKYYPLVRVAYGYEGASVRCIKD